MLRNIAGVIVAVTYFAVSFVRFNRNYQQKFES